MRLFWHVYNDFVYAIINTGDMYSFYYQYFLPLTNDRVFRGRQKKIMASLENEVFLDEVCELDSLLFYLK